MKVRVLFKFRSLGFYRRVGSYSKLPLEFKFRPSDISLPVDLICTKCHVLCSLMTQRGWGGTKAEPGLALDLSPPCEGVPCGPPRAEAMGSGPRAGSSAGLDRGRDAEPVFAASPKEVFSRMASTLTLVCTHALCLSPGPWVPVLTPGTPEMSTKTALLCSGYHNKYHRPGDDFLLVLGAGSRRSGLCLGPGEPCSGLQMAACYSCTPTAYPWRVHTGGSCCPVSGGPSVTSFHTLLPEAWVPLTGGQGRSPVLCRDTGAARNKSSRDPPSPCLRHEIGGVATLPPS